VNNCRLHVLHVSVQLLMKLGICLLSDDLLMVEQLVWRFTDLSLISVILYVYFKMCIEIVSKTFLSFS